MVDVRLDGKNNQKKITYTAATKEYATGEEYAAFSFPPGTVALRVGGVVTKADSHTDANGVPDAKMNVIVNGTTIGTVSLASEGVNMVEVTDIAGYMRTGGLVTFAADVNTNGDGSFIGVVEAIDVTRTNGEYIG